MQLMVVLFNVNVSEIVGDSGLSTQDGGKVLDTD